MEAVEVQLPIPSFEELEREFLPSFQEAFKTVPYLGEIYDWASINVELPAGYSPPGKYNVNLSPYFIEPFQAIRDPKIRQVNIMAPPRSGKTLVAEITLLYLIANSPGNILWIQSTEAASKKMGNARMAKLLKLCPPVEKLIDKNDRHAVTQTRYRFANGIEVHLASATMKSLQSFGYKYIVFDECWMADSGLIAEAQARIGDFPNTYKIILISQGGDMNLPDWENEFNKAPIREYGYICPKCKQEQLYLFNHRLKDKDWGGLVWSRNASTYEDKQWKISEASKTAVLKCTNTECKNHLEDTAQNREYLDTHSHYITTNAKGDLSKISFRLNALAVNKVSFQTLTKEWLEADKIEDDTGDQIYKEKFYQKRLAQTWGTQKTLPIVDLRVLAFPEGEEWASNAVRFMTVDVQRNAPRFWWLIREWCPNSDSRKIAHGTAHTWEELAHIREQYKVKIPRVLVDSGDGETDDEVFQGCTMPGYWGKKAGINYWFCYTACKGSNLKTFKSNGNQPFMLDSVRVNLPPDLKYKGVPGCPYVVWSNFRIKTVLDHLIRGKGAKWLSNDDDPEYRNQLSSEVVVREKNGPRYVLANQNDRNEFWDLEALQVLAATMYRIVTVAPPENVEPNEANN